MIQAAPMISTPVNRYLQAMGLLTVAQVADKYGITTQRVYQLAKARRIEGRTIGHLTVFNAAEVRQLKPGKPGRPWPKRRKASR